MAPWCDPDQAPSQATTAGEIVCSQSRYLWRCHCAGTGDRSSRSFHRERGPRPWGFARRRATRSQGRAATESSLPNPVLLGRASLPPSPNQSGRDLILALVVLHLTIVRSADLIRRRGLRRSNPFRRDFLAGAGLHAGWWLRLHSVTHAAVVGGDHLEEGSAVHPACGSDCVSRGSDVLLTKIDLRVPAMMCRVDESVKHPVPSGLVRRIRTAGVRFVEVTFADAL